MTEFKVPELGENVAGGDVMRVMVNVGDTVARDQPVLELETDKATIEVPVDGRRHGQGNPRQEGRQDQGRRRRPHRGRRRRGRQRRVQRPKARQDRRKPAALQKAARPLRRRSHSRSARGASLPMPPRVAPGSVRLRTWRSAAAKPRRTRPRATALVGPSPPRRPRFAAWRARSAWTSTRCRALARAAASRRTM